MKEELKCDICGKPAVGLISREGKYIQVCKQHYKEYELSLPPHMRLFRWEEEEEEQKEIKKESQFSKLKRLLKDKKKVEGVDEVILTEEEEKELLQKAVELPLKAGSKEGVFSWEEIKEEIEGAIDENEDYVVIQKDDYTLDIDFKFDEEANDYSFFWVLSKDDQQVDNSGVWVTGEKELAWSLDEYLISNPYRLLFKEVESKGSLKRFARIVQRQREGKKVWCVESEKTGRSFGCYPTREQAEKRLKQIEMFKHMKKKSVISEDLFEAEIPVILEEFGEYKLTKGKVYFTIEEEYRGWGIKDIDIHLESFIVYGEDITYDEIIKGRAIKYVYNPGPHWTITQITIKKEEILVFCSYLVKT